MSTNSGDSPMNNPNRGISMQYVSVRNNLKKLRTLKSFLFYLLPISLLMGLVFPKAAGSLNSLGLSLIQLISFPAIPLVLAAVVLSTHSILTISKNKKSKFSFTKRLVVTLIGIVIFVSLFALCLLYTSPSPRDRTRSRMPSSA